MGAWDVQGEVTALARSWRDIDARFADAVERVRVPSGRGIAHDGALIWAYKDRPTSIAQVLHNNLRLRPEQEAYVFHPSGLRLSWRQVGQQVQRAAWQLRHQHGFVKGDRLCLLTLGCPEYIIGYLAAVTLGGIAVPVNLGLTAEGLAAQVNKVGARHLVASVDIWRSKLAAVRDRLASVETVFLIGQDEPGTTEFGTLTATQAPALVQESIDEWDVCAISFTSGTTGVPKGTMAMHINAMGCAQAITDAAKGLGPGDINLCMPPLYHNTAVYTNFMPSLLHGGTCVAMAAFNPIEAIQLIERERVTWAVAAPIMLWMMMNHPQFKAHDCSSLKKILFGGHASSETFINQLQLEFAPIAMVNGGSVSESTALGFALPTEDAMRKITSCGLATPNTEIALFDDHGHAITQPGVIGEVAYKGQQTNAGYWDEPGKTAEVFRRDGYVLSGDWARIDDEGYLWLLDRKKDMVVRGGQNIYCIEVENKLYLHPKVLSAAVVGVPDHVFSERLKAVIVVKPGQSLAIAELRRHCELHLAAYEQPEYIVLAKAIATNPAGKTLKPALVDAWGEAEDASDKCLARLQACCDSLPDALWERPHFKLGNAHFTPREALAALQQGHAAGLALRQAIEAAGVVGLLKPDEARFRA